jgi:hypothetical protein
MRTWSVTARGLASVQVQGRNWIVALGRGLHELGRVDELSRLACEVLPNGTVIARDIATGTGYVVQGVDAPTGRVVPESAPPGGGPAPTGAEPTSEDGLVTLLPEALVPTDEPPAGLPDEAGAETFGEEDTYEEERTAEVIVELPADAITELPDEGELAGIDAAETPLMACQLALQQARERVPAESGAVILEERGYLRFSAVAGPASRKLMGVRLPLGTGVAGFAMEKRRTVVLSDAHQDPRHCGEVDALTGYVTREIAVVPVLHDDKVLGVLELMNLEGGRRFAEADVEHMQAVADALAKRLVR